MNLFNMFHARTAEQLYDFIDQTSSVKMPHMISIYTIVSIDFGFNHLLYQKR